MDDRCHNIAEKDMETVIGHLKIHDPNNSSRQDALEMMAYLQVIAKNLVNRDIKQEASDLTPTS